MQVFKSIRTRWGALSAVLLLAFFVLAACSDYTLATPTPPAQVEVQPPVENNIPALAAVPPTFAPATTPARAGVSPTKAPAIPVSAKKTVQTEITQAPASPVGFEEFPYANSDYFAYIPSHSRALGQSLQIVLTIHGMGGKGLSFAQPLVEYAEEYNLTLVAPTMLYDNDYYDPSHILANDATLLPELNNLLDKLPEQLQHPINPKILLFGFSRGAQIVHRFATFYPDRVLGVAVISAGNYTLPSPVFQANNNASKVNLRFPFGMSDASKYIGHEFDLEALRRVSFWIGVGGADTATKDVPAAWSPYLGVTRVERATHYYNSLEDKGIPATFTIFPGVGHTICLGMKQQAFAFFNKLVN